MDCTTNGDGPDPYSMCKFPFLNSGILIHDCISIKSPSGSNEACVRISKQLMKTHGTFPPDGYSQVFYCCCDNVATILCLTSSNGIQ